MQSQVIDHVDLYNNQATAQSIRSSAMYQGYDHQTWKLKRALQQKEEQVNVIEKNEEHMTRFYQEAPVSLSPLDYVKNRIAEVMRTSEEESGGGKDNESPGSGDVMHDEADHGGTHSTGHSGNHSTSHSTSHSSSHPPSHSSAHVTSHSSAGHTTSHGAAPTFLTQSHSYAYPFSALNLYTSAPSSVPMPSHPTSKPTESVPEPAPLLSSQYEPLSDED